jgi:hypothetical protein
MGTLSLKGSRGFKPIPTLTLLFKGRISFDTVTALK